MLTTLAVKYPPGKKYAACFTYDFDTMAARIGGLKQITPTQMSQGEFGAVGLQRILDLLDKYSVRASFYIPGYTIDAFPDLCKEIHSKGHEIGHHGYLHEAPAELTLEQEVAMLRKGLDRIKSITGSNALGYRAPAWNLSNNTIRLLLKEGFLYDSSMMAHDYLPYLVRIGDEVSTNAPYKFGRDTNLIELPVSWSLDDWPVFEYSQMSPGLKAGSTVLENWIADFDYMYEHVSGGVYSVCFHPQVSGRGHRMMVMEKLLQHIISKNDVWFTRMTDVALACGLPMRARRA